MKKTFSFFLAASIFCCVLVYASSAYTASDVVQPQQQAIPEYVQKIIHSLNLGPGQCWNYLGLAFSISILVELINSIRRPPNIMDVIGRLCVACVLSYLIYDIIPLIQNLMQSYANQIDGQLSFWDSITQRLRSYNERKSWGGVLTDAFNPLSTINTTLHNLNMITYLFVLAMKRLIFDCQHFMIVVLYAVVPIVVALSIIPGFDFIPSFIMTLFNVSSWTLFASIIGQVILATATQFQVDSPISATLTDAIINIAAGISIFAIPAFATTIFHSGGGLGAVASGVVGGVVLGAQQMFSRAAGAVFGGIAGMGGGRGLKGFGTGALTGGMLGPSSSADSFFNPKKIMRSFAEPPKKPGK